MKNIDNLRVLPLDLDIVIDWSPARELWKILRDDVMSSLWKHVHLSRLIRFETYKKPIINNDTKPRLSWLWKFGGLYVDTDMLVLQDILASFRNSSFIALQNLHPEVGFGSSIIKLSR